VFPFPRIASAGLSQIGAYSSILKAFAQQVAQAKPITRAGLLFANDLDQNSLISSSIKLAIEDLLPWAEIEPALRDSDNNLTAHDLALHVRIRVVFAGAIVMILVNRFMRRKLFKPDIVIMMKPAFIIVDKNRSCYVHGIDQHQSFLDAALSQGLLDLARDIDKPTTRGNVERQLSSVTFHMLSNRLNSLAPDYRQSADGSIQGHQLRSAMLKHAPDVMKQILLESQIALVSDERADQYPSRTTVIPGQQHHCVGEHLPEDSSPIETRQHL